MKGLWHYVRNERDALIFTIGLVLIFAALFQLEIASDYLQGSISCVIGLAMVFISALIRKIP